MKKLTPGQNIHTQVTSHLEVKFKHKVSNHTLILTAKKRVQGHQKPPRPQEVEGHLEVQGHLILQGHLVVQGHMRGHSPRVPSQITARARTQIMETSTGVMLVFKQFQWWMSLRYHQALLWAWQQVVHHMACSMLTHLL